MIQHIPENWRDPDHSDRGLVVSIEEAGEANFPLLEAYQDAKEETAKRLATELSSIASKFEGYEGSLRVVVLEFYGTTLVDDDVEALIQSASIPPEIDEIWLGHPEWISEYECVTGYVQVR